jgi:hypothetical protein
MLKRAASCVALAAALSGTGCGLFGGSDNDPPTVPVVTNHSQVYDGVALAWDFVFYWDPSIDPEGAVPVEYYAELWSTNASGSPTFPFDFENDGTLYASSGWITSTNWAVDDAPDGDEYVFRVKARDVAGHVSDWGVYENNTLGSCPFLFAWDGKKFAFESDVVTAGRLGTRGYQGYLRPYPVDYYVMTSTPAPKDGAYELRLTGERDEVEYVDEVQLYALYVPEASGLVGERPALGMTTFPGLERIHTTRPPLSPPRSAVHVNTGADVTSVVSASDDDVVTLNDDPNVGFEYQTLELDLGDLAKAPRIKLVLDGQSVFPTTPEGAARTALFGAFTRLEVPAADGSWTPVPREVVVMPPLTSFRRAFVLDLTHAFPAGDYRVRLTWLFKTFVDAVQVDTSADEPIRAVPLSLLSADLRDRGFSGRTAGERYQLVYEPAAARAPDYFPGAYTKYGDVRELLTTTDDRHAIFFGGDEVALRFEPAPPPAPGERLAFAFKAHGYYKDRHVDLPATVEPLPFDAMTNYPFGPGEAYPTDALHEEYRAVWNTRVK